MIKNVFKVVKISRGILYSYNSRITGPDSGLASGRTLIYTPEKWIYPKLETPLFAFHSLEFGQYFLNSLDRMNFQLWKAEAINPKPRRNWPKWAETYGGSLPAGTVLCEALMLRELVQDGPAME